MVSPEQLSGRPGLQNFTIFPARTVVSRAISEELRDGCMAEAPSHSCFGNFMKIAAQGGHFYEEVFVFPYGSYRILGWDSVGRKRSVTLSETKQHSLS